MASNTQYPQNPFWDFVQSFENAATSGAGVDHTQEQVNNNTFPFGSGPHGPGGHHGPDGHHGPGGHHHGPRGPPPHGFPFGGAGGWGFEGFGGRGGWGGRGGRRGHHQHGPPEGDEEGFSGSEGRGPCGGRRGGRRHRGPPGEGPEEGRRARGCRHGRRHHSHGPPGEGEKDGEGSRTASPSGEEHDGPDHDGPAHEHEHRRHGRHGRGRGGPRGGWGHHGRRGPPPPFGGPGAFDMSGLFAAINAHPMAQSPFGQLLRGYAEQAGFAPQQSGETLINPNADSDTFTPPVDIFSTETAYILHISVPGAKKEDVGVNWDADKGVLNVAGVVYRQGDEEFLKTLSKGERKVGMFEKNVNLPLEKEEKQTVDGEGITAKLEDGILVVTVPKIENWTEVKRVDID